jgi:REP element-mobilizing transposase RayT
MAFVRVWIHAVWGTKSRHPYLVNDIKQKVINHIKENAKQKEIFIDTIDGYHEHLHCLFGLNAEMSISKAMQLIKGESAFWINKQKITVGKFEWADEYFAVSISESQLDKVRTYINNQEEHHKKIAFMDEYEKFIQTYKFNSQC